MAASCSRSASVIAVAISSLLSRVLLVSGLEHTRGQAGRVAGGDGLHGAVAVVTGGASGIGEACVRLLQCAGADVQVVDLAADPPVDVTDRQALDSLAARLDRLDVLINAAGVLTENRPIDDLSVEDFRR